MHTFDDQFTDAEVLNEMFTIYAELGNKQIKVLFRGSWDECHEYIVDEDPGGQYGGGVKMTTVKELNECFIRVH